MAVRNLLARLGAGAATVDTQLASPYTQPGGTVSGRVHLVGGKVAQDVSGVRLALQTTVEVESGDAEFRGDVTFGEAQVAPAPFSLQPGDVRDLPFSLRLPAQCPVTNVGGWALRGVRVGVRTTVEIAGSVDPGDLDAVEVHPLPVQNAVLAALDQMGFRFVRADVEHGRIAGSDLPFYQEFEFVPGPSHRGRLNELEVTFLVDPAGVDVVLEGDRRGGLLTSGYDSLTRFRIGHTDTDPRRLVPLLDGAVRQLGSRRGWF
ncbi:MAG: sporulation protein [Actinomycetota bacterium]|nr:sporulation protein [Actinomycetota bacterium]